MPDAPAISGPPQFRMPAVARVRAHYALLCAAAATQFGAGSLAGRLLLIDGLGDEGDALLIAASIAGAASLVLETGTEAVRHCVRNGIVDFAVTTLAEALRILKNEVRKRQPIAVLLERQPMSVLAEMVERGAQPDMLRWTAPDPALKGYIDTMRERGARPLPSPSATPADSPTPDARANDPQYRCVLARRRGRHRRFAPAGPAGRPDAAGGRPGASELDRARTTLPVPGPAAGTLRCYD